MDKLSGRNNVHKVKETVCICPCRYTVIVPIFYQKCSKQYPSLVVENELRLSVVMISFTNMYKT